MSAVDRIREGVDAETLTARGDTAVWAMLISTAISYQLRSRPYLDWATAIDQPTSNLGRQASIVSKTEQPRKRLAVEKLLRKAWKRAEDLQTTGTPLRTPDDFRAEAKLLGEALDQADDLDLLDLDRRVLRYVLDLAEQHSTHNPCVPARPAAAALDTTPMSISRSLRRLTEAGWLDLLERGTPRGPQAAGPPRASRYTVPSEQLTARLPISQVLLTGAGNCVSNTSHFVSNTREEPTMITITRTPDGQVTATAPMESEAWGIAVQAMTNAGYNVALTTTTTDDTNATVIQLADRRASA